MKILIVMDQFNNPNNGTTISAKRFAKVLEELGNEVSVVSIGEKDKNEYPVREIIVPIVTKIIRSQGMQLAIPDRKILTKAIQNADVVHFAMPFSLSKVGLKICKELNVPCTAAFHVQPENVTYTLGLGKVEKVNSTIYSYFRDTFYNKFTHIHCPSNFIANELKKNGYTAKLHVISNGIDPKFEYRKINKMPELEGKIVILMVGRLSNEKRQDVLINAVKKSKFADKIQLILAGKGPKEKHYAELGKSLKHKPIMKFYSQQELMDIIAMADLYVHASDAEIEAISCMEAFASGLVPIIANSKKSATPQFALDDRSLFKPGDSIELARKIDYWLDNNEERKRMEYEYSNQGKKYNIVECVKQIQNMFKEAIDEKRT